MKLSIYSGLAIVAAFGTVACSDSTSPAAGRPVSVSFSTGTSSGASLARMTDPGASRDAATVPAADGLVITKVQLVVARMELERAGASCTSTEPVGDDEGDEHEHDCPELHVAPALVEVPVNGTVVSPFTVNVPAGSYSALEAKIRPLHAESEHGRGSSAFLAAHPELNGVSVVVEGTFNGTAFTYKGAPRAEFEREFNPPLVVDKPLNVTVHLDIASWFRTQSGAVIDPSTANAPGVNAATVAVNIMRSFHAFRDDDRDGHDDDDHGGH
jgi:hypothetical protein